MFSDNVDLQRSASLTFAEITERGTFILWMVRDTVGCHQGGNVVLYSVEMFSAYTYPAV